MGLQSRQSQGRQQQANDARYAMRGCRRLVHGCVGAEGWFIG